MDFISKSMFQRIFDYKSNCQSILIKIKLSKAFDGLAPDVCGANEPRSAHAQLNAKHFFGHTQQCTWTFYTAILHFLGNILHCPALQYKTFTEPFCTSLATYTCSAIVNFLVSHIALPLPYIAMPCSAILSFLLCHIALLMPYIALPAILHFWASISSTRSTEQ